MQSPGQSPRHPQAGSHPEFVPGERQALADTARDLGPDAPTIDDGWQVRDLVAHVVLRERRPDAAPGIMLKPLSGWTAKVQAKLADQPFDDLVEQLRAGPPTFSPLNLPRLRESMNLLEFFVHHEDVRRAQVAWEPRLLDVAMQEAMWRHLRLVAKLRFRTTPLAVTLRPTLGESLTVGKRGGEGREVAVAGDVGELAMWLFDRQRVARVIVDGDPADVRLVVGA